MADKHPYMSGSNGIIQAVAQLRKSFPAVMNADTLKKLGIASNNESLLINILRFVGVIDTDGKKTAAASSAFSKHDDAEFHKEFATLVESAYADLFSLHGENAWNLQSDKLISYFRNTDQSSAIVGQRQATTFQALAGLAGRIDSSNAGNGNAAKSRSQASPRVKSVTISKAMLIKVQGEGGWNVTCR